MSDEDVQVELEDEILDNEAVETEQEVDNVDEEVDNEEKEVDNEETSQEEVVERAKKYGHLSKEEWIAAGKDPNKYKTPEEFDKTGKVIEQLYTLKKKVDQRDREIQALIDYQQRTSQREYERARQELESRLASSKDDMDVEGVAHYTKELTKLEESENYSQAQQMQKAQQVAQAAFIERNQHWFNDRNSDLMNRAIEIDNELKSIYPNASYEELAEKIEKRMQYEHPERVSGTFKSKPHMSPSHSSVNKTAINTSSVKRTFQGLSQELKDTYNAHRRIRASLGEELTEAEFIERLKKDGEL